MYPLRWFTFFFHLLSLHFFFQIPAEAFFLFHFCNFACCKVRKNIHPFLFLVKLFFHFFLFFFASQCCKSAVGEVRENISPSPLFCQLLNCVFRKKFTFFSAFTYLYSPPNVASFSCYSKMQCFVLQ